MSKLPVVSGGKLLKLLGKLGYTVVRQKGSHVRLRKMTVSGEHNITVPLHEEIAKGTLNDILSRVSVYNSISRDKLIQMIKEVLIA
nr:type II toxin-antitoxin system HicA family toxin [Candidatus Njordarchaeota archaeon]